MSKRRSAIGRAEALSRKEGHVGAVAFSRTGGPATGDFSDAKVIKKFGDVPDDLLANPVRRLTLATCFHPLVAKIQRLVDGTFRSRSDIGWLPPRNRLLWKASVRVRSTIRRFTAPLFSRWMCDSSTPPG
jgi:hypothetical protein